MNTANLIFGKDKTAIVRNVYQPVIILSHSLWLIIPWTILITLFARAFYNN